MRRQDELQRSNCRAQPGKHADRSYLHITTPFYTLFFGSFCLPFLCMPLHGFAPVVYKLISYKVQIVLLGSGTCSFSTVRKLVSGEVHFLSLSPCLFCQGFCLSIFFLFSSFFLGFPIDKIPSQVSCWNKHSFTCPHLLVSLTRFGSYH